MNDLIVVELDQNLEKIVAANLYSGATGEWLLDVKTDELQSVSEHKTVVLMLDGRIATMHQIPVPNLDDAKLLKILPGLMDEKIATSAQQNQFALVGQYNPETGSRAVCVIGKEILATVLSRVTALGINPDFAVPDFVLLGPPEQGACVVALPDRYVVRAADGNGFAGEKNIIDAVIGEAQDTEIISVADWRARLGQATGLGGNFLHGDFAQRASWLAGFLFWKRPFYLAALVAMVFISLYYYNAVQNYQSAEALYAKSETLFRAALPDEPRIVNMEVQLRRAMVAQRQAGGGEFLTLFASAVQAVEADPTASIETVRYDENDGELLLTVSFTSFAETTKFNAFLASAGMQVTEGSSRQESGRVFADLRVRRP